MSARLNFTFPGYLAVATVALFISACGGGGGGGGGGGVTPPPPSGGNTTVSGRITFDRAPFKAQLGTGVDLNNPVEAPARQVVVEVIDANTSLTLGSTTTDTAGDYAVTVPQNRSVFVRAKAQMLKTDADPTWQFRVLNNTNGDALYALDGSVFNTGTAASTRNLKAATGWGGTSYTGARAAAPFAILDTVYEATQLILAAEPGRSLPALDLFWSGSNRTASGCYDDGNIGTTFYTTGGQDDCNEPISSGIYVLGDFAGGNGDTDEFDAHVIAHEFGHYYEDIFSRSDSLGGEHGGDDRTDFRLAFGEGWGNAFSGMALDNPEYRDSFSGVSDDFGYNMESDDPTPEGWYSEVSISEILWDIYDAGSEPNDALALGFAPIHQAMTGRQRTTDALTSIFSFAEALRNASPASASGLNALLAGESISSTDEFAVGETSNNGGDPEVLPLYGEIGLNQQATVCSRAIAGATDRNKLGNRKFLRFANDTARTVGIAVNGAVDGIGTSEATDPDLFVYRRGDFEVVSQEVGNESVTVALDAGLYVIEVYDFDIEEFPSTTRCMTVSITGN